VPGYPEGMSDGCDTGVCGADVPPVIGSVLTGAGLTIAQAVAALERGEEPPLTPVQRRIVEERALQTGSRERSSITPANASTTR
jgi:hypothetical protein